MATLLFAPPTLPASRRAGAAATLAVFAAAAFATPAEAQPSTAPSRAAAPPSVPAAFVCAVPGAGSARDAAARPAGAESASAGAARPASALRVALGARLGQHAYLLMEAMRAAATGSPDATAIDATLDANTDAIAAAIGSVYGDAAGTGFRAIWERHIDAARAYGDAVRMNDSAARERATAELEAFKSDLDTFLQQANPQLDAKAEVQAVSLHLEQLRAFADGDYAQAYRVARQAYGHMYELGDMLARAVARQFPDRFPDERVAFSPASELRVALDQLLGEHLVLAAEAMRSSIASSPDTAAARQALDANADDLATAIGSIYGDAAETSFSEVWRAHLDAYLAYIDAVGAGDTARADAARASLAAYGRVFGEFMAKANPKLSADDVATLISHHTQSLLAMVDAYRAGDTATAYRVVSEAYDHMFTVGDALAAAIAAQFPREFRDLAEPPATDTTAAGRAHVHGAAAPGTHPLAPPPAGLLGLAGLLAAGVWGVATRRRGRARMGHVDAPRHASD